MAARVELTEGRTLGAKEFAEEYEKVSDHLFFQCLDDRGQAQGHAVAEVVKKFRSDPDGAFLQLRYVQVSDPYYQHWLESSGGGNFYHHLCAGGLRTCERKVGKEALVHVQHWLAIDKNQVKSIVKGWKTVPLNYGPPKAPRGRSLVEEPVHTAPKARPDRRDHGGHREATSPGEGRGETEDRRARSEVPGGGQEVRKHRRRTPSSSSHEDDDVGKSNARRGRSSGRRRRSRRESRSPTRCRPEDARGSVGQSARREGEWGKKPNPLDAMLEDEGWDPLKPDEKLEALRKTLEDQKRKRSEVKEGASAVLARRAQAGAEVSKKRKKDSEKEKMVKALKSLAVSKAKGESTSSEPESDDDDALFGGGRKDGELLGRQRRLRKLSAERPGALLTRGFALMHEQLGTLHGDVSSAGTKEDVLQPGALRYLLSSALPMTDVKKIGEERMRELRTLATALDLVVGGKVSTAGDYLMQRFKSILMSLRDGSTAASKYLELVPLELYPTATSLEETDFARSLAVKGAKSQELLDRVASSG